MFPVTFHMPNDHLIFSETKPLPFPLVEKSSVPSCFMRLIILPQAFKNVLPALGNEMIVLLKETSISGYVGTMDLTKGGDIIRSTTYEAYLPLFGVAAIYLVIVMLMTAGVNRLERKLRTNER